MFCFVFAARLLAWTASSLTYPTSGARGTWRRRQRSTESVRRNATLEVLRHFRNAAPGCHVKKVQQPQLYDNDNDDDNNDNNNDSSMGVLPRLGGPNSLPPTATPAHTACCHTLAHLEAGLHVGSAARLDGTCRWGVCDQQSHE